MKFDGRVVTKSHTMLLSRASPPHASSGPHRQVPWSGWRAVRATRLKGWAGLRLARAEIRCVASAQALT
jgi:hypothetical protein